MAEALGEVAKLLARRGVDLLGQQAEVIGLNQHVLEERMGFVELACQGQSIRQPEAAQGEHALVAGQARAISAAVWQSPISAQSLMDG